MTLLYKGDAERGAKWATLLATLEPALDVRIWPDIGDPDDILFVAAWEPPHDLATAYRNLEIVFSVGAGVDQFDLSLVPPHIPVVRMIEPGIGAGMVEYVTQAVLMLHRDGYAYQRQQALQQWLPLQNMPAAERRVGVLGMGRLGMAVLECLQGFGFACAGWNRSPRALDGVQCFAGTAALDDFLARTDILICLLPLTDETHGFLNADRFARLPRGAALIQTGRGKHLVPEDLLSALDSGQLSEAVLDVTDPEPLPPGHAFWHHPRVHITPHVASITRPEGAVQAILDNLQRHRDGKPLNGLVDRQRGY